MVTKCFCDRCGTPGASRLYATVATNANIFVDETKKFDMDLCHQCAVRARDIIQQSYVTAALNVPAAETV